MLAARSREIQWWLAEAEALGGNAIDMTRFSTSQVMSGAAELLAHGTAVVVEPAPTE